MMLPSPLLTFVFCTVLRQSWALVHTAPAQQVSIINHCPSYCKCSLSVPTSELIIRDCHRDPVKDIGDVVLANKNILTLRVINSHMSALPAEVCALNKLKVLVLDNNNLRDLPWACLRNMDSLTSIGASHNEFTTLRNGTFYRFKNLVSLDFRSNTISEIEDDVFNSLAKLPHLTTLNLSWNRLLSLDSMILKLMSSGRRMTVSLEHNRISQFTNRRGWIYDCSMQPKLNKYKIRHNLLNVSYNNISHITDPMICWNLTQIATACVLFSAYIDMRGNPLNCDCKDFVIYKLFKAMVRSAVWLSLDCWSPERLRGQVIASLPLTEFVCHAGAECPPGCDCLDTPATMNMTIICENIGMTDLPQALPPRPKRHYRYHLFFQHNNITSIQYRPYLEFVETLSLSNNNIKNLSLQTLSNLTTLKYFHLDSNSLRSLPVSESNSTLGLESLSEMYLRNNSWACDCHSLITKHFLVRHKAIVKDWRAVMCAYPERLQSTNLFVLADDKFICGDPPNRHRRNIIIAVGGTLTVCLVLIMFPIAILYKKPMWIYRIVKLHPVDWDDCQSEDIKFDTFVSYAEEDRDYIEENLIPGLQRRDFKVCFHRRNFMPGTHIGSNIAEAIRKSKRTLVYLSDSFNNSTTCRAEFKLAIDRDLCDGRRRLVVVKDTALDVDKLNAEIQSYLRSISAKPKPAGGLFERGSDHFWEELLTSLPVNKLGKPGEGDDNNIEYCTSLT